MSVSLTVFVCVFVFFFAGLVSSCTLVALVSSRVVSTRVYASSSSINYKVLKVEVLKVLGVEVLTVL